MNAYLLNGWITEYPTGRSVDLFSSGILAGFDAEGDARRHFQESLLMPVEGDPPVPRIIRKVIAAPVLDRLLTESGPIPIDWDQVANEVVQALQGTSLDQSDRGYWVDCNHCLTPERLPESLTTLQRDLPEDIGAALNWDAGRTYVFIAQVLSPPESNGEPVEEGQEMPKESARAEEQDSAALDNEKEPDEPASLALLQKELVAVVKARNAVVAAWLWRRHAKETPLAGNDIQVGPWIETLIRDPDGSFRMAGENAD